MADGIFLIVTYLGYAGLKFVGYSLAAWVIRAILMRPDRSPWRVGLARTILGIVVGGIYTAAWGAMASHGLFSGLPLSGGRAGPALWYLVGLVPVRLLEWTWLIWYFFDRRFAYPGRGGLCVALGTLWSFVLDVPAIMGVASFVASIC
ncbi:MAG: hypothetical protein ACHQO8_05425 [Vicinamibacterales bacterium]